MSIVWARRKIKNTYLFDLEDMNDLLSSFSDEIAGNLNEHNWTDACVEDMVAADQVEKGFALSLKREVTELDPQASVAGLTKIPQSTAWTPIDCAGAEVEFDSKGGKAFFSFSFQARLVGTPALKQSGLNFAIEVDGTVYNESLIGSADLSNDFLDVSSGARFVGAIDGTGAGFEFDYGSSPSIRALHIGLCAELIAELSVGKHTAKLVARNLFTADTVSQYTSNVEGIALPMWA